MKLHVLLCSFLAFTTTLYAQQWVEIPDPNLRAALLNPNNLEPATDLSPFFNGDSLDVSASEVQGIVSAILTIESISSLTGMEWFSGLEELNVFGNEIQSISSLPPSLVKLDLRSNELTHLPILPTSLIHLACSINNLISLPNLPSGMEYLDCMTNELLELPPLPNELRELYCKSNQLSMLPTLPDSLVHLNCGSNPITSLPTLPESLNYLTCSFTELTQLPALPTTLKHLHCGVSPIQSIPDLPPSLTELLCYFTEIQFLPDLPDSLKKLECRNNSIPSLPVLPEGLEFLDISTTLIPELPTLPDSLQELICKSINLIEISTLPAHLKKLDCGTNPLTELPPLPPGLEVLHCKFGSLQSLPSLPESLLELNCRDNQIEILPELPSNLEFLECFNNELHCVPLLPNSLEYVAIISGNQITCIPNIPQGSLYFNDFLGIPICTANNIYGCHWLTVVTGNVYDDQNENCSPDSTELNLSGVIIQSSSGDYAISDSTGNYELYLDTGSHIISQSPLSLMWQQLCPNPPHSLTISSPSDTISDIDFPNHADQICPWLTVSLSSSNQRPCFSTNSYSLEYCNDGTQDASDAFIELELDQSIIPLNSSTPWTDLGNNVIRFDLGDVAIGECGFILLTDSVDCNAEVGYTVCSRAEIFPTSPCFVADPSWDNSSIEVTSTCTGGDNQFTISNVGTGNMGAPSLYRVYQGNSIYQNDTQFQLNAGESLVVTVPADGQMYRLSADQSIGHAGMSTPQAWVEGCGMPPFQLGEILSFSQDDQDDHIDIECRELSAAYDPNDKTVVPAGFGPEHNIQMTDTLLEYRIRFQNTGSDTAFNVVVVDTLDLNVLDITTFESGASSHDYWVDIYGQGVVSWHFDNILLPDSNVNEPASNGFVSFKIRRFGNLPVGTMINNSASIYFDFNAPILTNTSFVTLSEPLVLVSVQDHLQQSIDIFPTPIKDEAMVTFDHVEYGQVELINALGKTIQTKSVSGNQFNLNVDGIDSGIYFVRVTENGKLIGTRKVTVTN